MPEDFAAATALFTQLLQKQGVPTTRVGVVFVAVAASDSCVSHRDHHEAHIRTGDTKHEPAVDADQSDTVGLSFLFDVLGNALDVKLAVIAANHIPYQRTDAWVLRSPVWLNYGSGTLQPSQRKCRDISLCSGAVHHRLRVVCALAVCDETCETCLDSSKHTCVSCHSGFELSSHSKRYGKCIAENSN